MNRMSRLLPLVVFFSVTALDASFAQGGLSQVNTLLTTIQTTLTSISVVVLTIAIIWSGYKLMWGHAGIMEIVPVLGGGILIAGASQIASMMLGS